MKLRAGGVVAALAAVSLIAAAPAVAQKAGAKGKNKAAKVGKIRTATSAPVSTTNDGQLVSAIATCPRKTKVLSGGFKTDYANDFLEIYESRRLTASSWRVSAARDAAAPTGPVLNVTAFAYCRSGLAKMPEGSQSTLISGGGPVQGSATASCRGGNKAVSGGFAYNPPAFGIATEDPAQHYESFRSSPNAWTATIDNVVGGFGRTLTAYVYCRRGKQLGLQELVRSVPPGSQVPTLVSTGRCRGKSTALSGGYRATPPTATSAAPLIVSSLLDGKAWEVSGVSPLGPGSVIASAYCG